MANQTVTNWFLTNAALLSPKVTHNTWVNWLLPEYFDVNVEFSINGEIYEGRGTEKDQELAIEKAFTEAAERYMTKKLKLYDHGVSAHVTYQLALEGARKESIERYLFFSLFPNLQSLLNITDKEFEVPNNIQSFALKNGFEVVSRKLGWQDDFSLALVLFKSKSNLTDIFIGLGIASDTPTAFDKALVEATRSFVAYVELGSKQEFYPSGFNLNPNFNAHSIDFLALSNFEIFLNSPLAFCASSLPYIENYDTARLLNGE